MLKDPIVDEIHKIREDLLKEFDGDMIKYVNYIREQEKKHPERLVSREDLIKRRKAKNLSNPMG